MHRSVFCQNSLSAPVSVKENKTSDDIFSEARNLHQDQTEESFIPASRS